jgi:hypothetical protein
MKKVDAKYVVEAVIRFLVINKKKRPAMTEEEFFCYFDIAPTAQSPW